ncbi:MAG: dTMP kinase, partial [Candidatus Komeilibacteria bacterium]|nr:dTMP kinase [Candidatus Komeilibacteria bacterium]
MRQISRGCLVLLEGLDGCGKGLQAKLIVAYLQSLGLKVLPMQEPGSTLHGLACRALLKYPQ